MSQAQLDREVAQLTGESVGFIRSMGFSPLNLPSPPRRKAYRRQAVVRMHQAQFVGQSEPALRKAA